MPLFGAHQSIAGGLHVAFDRIEQVGGESLQIFTANQRQWQSPPLLPSIISLFKERWAKAGNIPVAAHASYLINLAADDPAKADKSIAAFAEELKRCHQLGIETVVIHPGSHGGLGIEAGLERVARNLDLALERSGILMTPTRVLLETTAGQGTSLGSRFEELAWLLARTRYPAHVGICLDTCHIFAAGYDFRTPELYAQTFHQLEQHTGVASLLLLHLNDAKKECGSHVDRHEQIGAGFIGLEGFRLLVNDPRFRQHAMLLETEKGMDLTEDVVNLRRLRALIE